MLITHDLGVVAEMADDVVVMYAGKVVENADVATIFETPHHPYTQGLLASIPRLGEKRRPPRGRSRASSRTRSTCPRAACSSAAARTRCRCCDTPPPLQQVGPGHRVALLADADRRATGGRRGAHPEAAEEARVALSVVQ